MTRHPVPSVERPFIGSFPYGGTSGYAPGSPTSEDRARTEDTTGRTARRQRAVLALLEAAQAHGGTWFEVADRLALHHGQASGVLSGLHRTHRVARLTERRGRCAVYVVPAFVCGRDTEDYGGGRGGTTAQRGDPS